MSRRLLRTTWHLTSVAFAVSATVLLSGRANEPGSGQRAYFSVLQRIAAPQRWEWT